MRVAAASSPAGVRTTAPLDFLYVSRGVGQHAIRPGERPTRAGGRTVLRLSRGPACSVLCHDDRAMLLPRRPAATRTNACASEPQAPAARQTTTRAGSMRTTGCATGSSSAIAAVLRIAGAQQARAPRRARAGRRPTRAGPRTRTNASRVQSSSQSSTTTAARGFSPQVAQPRAARARAGASASRRRRSRAPRRRARSRPGRRAARRRAPAVARWPTRCASRKRRASAVQLAIAHLAARELGLRLGDDRRRSDPRSGARSGRPARRLHAGGARERAGLARGQVVALASPGRCPRRGTATRRRRGRRRAASRTIARGVGGREERVDDVGDLLARGHDQQRRRAARRAGGGRRAPTSIGVSSVGAARGPRS